ncbi:MAG: InlB B-repeat-containing protein, partial [Lachnospiraceae bacterium]|nr:InlB B-repeat-containing protein [Lachnospiraceae bacterium]
MRRIIAGFMSFMLVLTSVGLPVSAAPVSEDVIIEDSIDQISEYSKTKEEQVGLDETDGFSDGETGPFAEKNGVPSRVRETDENIVEAEIKEDVVGSYNVACNMSYQPVTGNADAANLPVGIDCCGPNEYVVFNLHVGEQVFIKNAVLRIYKNGNLYSTFTPTINKDYIRFAPSQWYKFSAGSYTYNWSFTYSSGSYYNQNASYDIGNSFTVPNLSSSYSSMVLDLNGTTSKSTNITIGYKPSNTGLNISFEESVNGIVSPSWGSWSGNKIPLTVKGLKVGTTTITCTLKDSSTKTHEYAKKSFTVTVKDSTPSYTVSFNANGGSCSTSSKTVRKGNLYGTLPTPARTGYTFLGWYTSSSGGTKITSSSTA